MTNNTYNTSGTYTLDHTTDTAAANAIVQNLYETALGQAATASGLATYSAALLNGTMTETQIAAALIGTSQFLTEYGSLSNADFVSQIFVNGLGRQPTAAEAAYWTGELNSGAVSKADLVAAMAQSPDHLETLNGTQVIQVSGTGNIIYASGDTLDFASGASGTVDSSGNTINLASNVTVTINGSGTTVNAVAGDTVIFGAGLTATVNADGATIEFASGDTATVNGYQDAIGLKGGDTVSVNGCTDTVDIGGTGNAITLSYSTLTIEARRRRNGHGRCQHHHRGHQRQR